jgi:ribulose 1,5-bisphosphate synthetase/thiazole synthase
MDNQIDSSHAENKSIWAATAQMPAFKPLHGNVDADVCVIGAGIAGLSTAYQLTQARPRICPTQSMIAMLKSNDFTVKRARGWQPKGAYP